MPEIRLPEFCLLLLVGPSGSGKSTFARSHFSGTEILSSDSFRAMVADDEEAQDASADAFSIIEQVTAARLRRRLLTVIDATNLQSDYRMRMVSIARDCFAPAVAIILDVGEKTCAERNRERPLRRPRRVIARHVKAAHGVLKSARREGFAHVHRVAEGEERNVTIIRERLWTDARHQTGPFDIIGDVHGCFTELEALLRKLGYTITPSIDFDGERRFEVSHPEGRRIIFVGDLCDRGPDSPGVFALAMSACESGSAFAVKGNHDVKLMRHLRGQDVSPDHGFALTSSQFQERTGQAFRDKVRSFIDGLTSHLLLDGGSLAVAHAGVKEAMQGRAGRLVSEFCTFGERTGETDEFSQAIRFDWAAEYRGVAAVAYGHVTTQEANWVGNTICLDTGCVFGGSLTALRWPEREIVSVVAEQTWFEPVRPMIAKNADLPIPASQLPDAAILVGHRLAETRFGRAVSITPSQAAPAFEALARFGAGNRWLVFIPPTTATVEASARKGWLEHPDEAFAHYASAGITRVCVQEKHMGSRACVVACRDQDASFLHFGDSLRLGAVTSKSGRPFFSDPEDEAHIIDAVRSAMDNSGLWDELKTNFVVLDGEMLPWNAKAGSLIRDTFAATGAAGRESARATCEVFARASSRGVEGAHELAWRATERASAMDAFRLAYGAFVLPFGGREDLRFAPFHILAAAGRVFADESHVWHMSIADRLSEGSPFLLPTRWMEIDPSSSEETSRAVAWWEETTAHGHEGFIVKGEALRLCTGGIAPSIKVRGRDYLRIIYGPEYDRPETLPSLKKRGTGRKRTLARIGMSLGLESLALLVEGASAARIHEAVAASMAIASEPLDARL